MQICRFLHSNNNNKIVHSHDADGVDLHTRFICCYGNNRAVIHRQKFPTWNSHKFHVKISICISSEMSIKCQFTRKTTPWISRKIHMKFIYISHKIHINFTLHVSLILKLLTRISCKFWYPESNTKKSKILYSICR